MFRACAIAVVDPEQELQDLGFTLGQRSRVQVL
jgi:hypothetical protein